MGRATSLTWAFRNSARLLSDDGSVGWSGGRFFSLMAMPRRMSFTASPGLPCTNPEASRVKFELSSTANGSSVHARALGGLLYALGVCGTNDRADQNLHE